MSHYRAVADACERMLEAGRRGDWAEVARIEAQTRSPIEAIQEHRSGESLTPAQRREKYRILHRIVSIDAQLRHLGNPRQVDVDRLLDRISSQPWKGGASGG